VLFKVLDLAVVSICEKSIFLFQQANLLIKGSLLAFKLQLLVLQLFLHLHQLLLLAAVNLLLFGAKFLL
jgi:hypothetical protein